MFSNNEPTKSIVHEKHERHEQDMLLFVLFVPFVDSVFCLRIRFLMGCSFSGITLCLVEKKSDEGIAKDGEVARMNCLVILQC